MNFSSACHEFTVNRSSLDYSEQHFGCKWIKSRALSKHCYDLFYFLLYRLFHRRHFRKGTDIKNLKWMKWMSSIFVSGSCHCACWLTVTLSRLTGTLQQNGGVINCWWLLWQVCCEKDLWGSRKWWTKTAARWMFPLAIFKTIAPKIGLLYKNVVKFYSNKLNGHAAEVLKYFLLLFIFNELEELYHQYRSLKCLKNEALKVQGIHELIRTCYFRSCT